MVRDYRNDGTSQSLTLYRVTRYVRGTETVSFSVAQSRDQVARHYSGCEGTTGKIETLRTVNLILESVQ